MPQVTIHRREATTVFTTEGEPREMVAVTYSTSEVPPRTILVPKAEATDQRIAQAIRQDLDEQLKQRPTTMEV